VHDRLLRDVLKPMVAPYLQAAIRAELEAEPLPEATPQPTEPQPTEPRDEPEPEPELEPAPEPAPAPAPSAPLGTVLGLRTTPEMNGRRVMAMSFNPDSGRYRVVEVGEEWRRQGEARPWGSKRMTMIRPENLSFEGIAATHATAMRTSAEGAHRILSGLPEPRPEAASSGVLL